jgi:hypothetical protein
VAAVPFRRRCLHGLGLRRHLALDALGGVDGFHHPRAQVRVLEQQLAGVLAPLPDPLALEGEPGAALLHHAAVGAEVEQIALHRDPAVVEDVELRLPEGRRQLVLHHLDPGAVADHLVAVLEGRDAPHVEPH